MGKKVKLIIADDDRAFCKMLQNHLQSQEDFSLVGVVNHGLEAWELIQTLEPDLIILDLVMPFLDGFGVLERINAHTIMKRPKIIIQTAFRKESLTNAALKLGVDDYVLKPFDLDILSKRIRSLTQDKLPDPHQLSYLTSLIAPNEVSEYNLFLEVTTIMQQIGIPAHVKGYQYIRDAILMVVEDVSLLGAVTLGIYPSIAKKHGSTPSKIERGIRHAIQLAWERGQTDIHQRIFGYSMNIEHRKPTNSEFIAFLADEFRVRGKLTSNSLELKQDNIS